MEKVMTVEERLEMLERLVYLFWREMAMQDNEIQRLKGKTKPERFQSFDKWVQKVLKAYGSNGQQVSGFAAAMQKLIDEAEGQE